MSGQVSASRGRTFLAGKIVFNFGRSAFDCTVRQLTETSATVELESVVGIPDHIQLLLVGSNQVKPCKRLWQSDRQLGLVFEEQQANAAAPAPAAPAPAAIPERRSGDILRGHMLALRAALDQIPVGILLLDAELKALFINRAFRSMWALPDAVADRNPTFADLMQHGCKTMAYELPAEQLHAYLAERVRLVSVGDPNPIDLRRSNGDVVRCQCTPLPDGGRMVSYTPVTDIVRASDKLKLLTGALENVEDGVVLLDRDLNAIFLNRRMREFWEVSEEEVARHPAYITLLTRNRRAVPADATPEQVRAFPAKRIAEIKAGDHKRDMQTPDGRHIRIHCSTMANGGRMLTFVDVTDLVRNARQLEVLATTDPLTGLFNRRHFLTTLDAEWSRFQRYYRSVSVLMVDIDHFKSINDRFGHAVGDEAIKAVAGICIRGKRKSDVVGRVGGEEFAVLLPETTLSRARTVAERIRKRAEALTVGADDRPVSLTVSIGVAEALTSMPGIDALMKAADAALYQAKEHGRNRTECWSPPSPPKLATG
ncbi:MULTISPECIES: sensor domain-containing diguanylate cyclase [Bradyrhizobium]|jgi:diguanylate cyclase (GGDEF)-like protein|uniref:sensor domain-containing diguanylate cyclase n=1 Tax=Bradyrhizobium TaxID=374 RepID=UPI000480FDAC|nr:MULTISPECIES: sensor domain-containing diguanylate cyclase [Bradyrhizobium]MCS3449252.1 diguanylate cyclase (GGDEF)-like protein [Bradyrhizobium elkanii]MCS3559605.1 diguanylate cyclase (GGDEF)-like protein [Bradyrhizobium elkanii]MCW2150549.1 diguanylate cyclase (GGDEF)-like protein [Bradyrhizobium elkanii]MCW2359393.1 diguanylate cyclase (GGDEF)-like protein [Bradyrhizobium elkanii]MCW2374280.1 diguanylate cyclase (GGDEF)-like protein [Bradyrhizobium elkanii]